jgi:hypothetical protein
MRQLPLAALYSVRPYPQLRIDIFIRVVYDRFTLQSQLSDFMTAGRRRRARQSTPEGDPADIPHNGKPFDIRFP